MELVINFSGGKGVHSGHGADRALLPPSGSGGCDVAMLSPDRGSRFALGTALSRHILPREGGVRYSTVAVPSPVRFDVVRAMSNQPNTPMDNLKMITMERGTPEWERMWNCLALANMVQLGGELDRNSYNPTYHEGWQYMGTWGKPGERPVHEFRHRMHPVTNKREYMNIDSQIGVDGETLPV